MKVQELQMGLYPSCIAHELANAAILQSFAFRLQVGSLMSKYPYFHIQWPCHKTSYRDVIWPLHTLDLQANIIGTLSS